MQFMGAFILALSCMLGEAAAQPASAYFSDYADYNEKGQAFLDAITPQHGSIDLAHSIHLSIDDKFYFLDTAGARKVLEEMWNNPPDPDILGMILPASISPLHDSSWGVVLTFEDIGYVSDDDAVSIDYDELLEQMKADTRSESKARVEQGYDPIELVGWAQDPKYDFQNKRLHWAKELRFGDAETNTLNYNIRVLGREGVLQMNYVASMDDLEEINASIGDMMAQVSFGEGKKYTDFVAGADKVAAIGIGGLIAGKVLTKTGFLVAALVLLKKFWFVLLLPLIWLKNLFTGKKDE